MFDTFAGDREEKKRMDGQVLGAYGVLYKHSDILFDANEAETV